MEMCWGETQRKYYEIKICVDEINRTQIKLSRREGKRAHISPWAAQLYTLVILIIQSV